MLYPIELLRHKSPARNAGRWTACMLTGRPAFVMSSVGLFKCRQTPCGSVALFTVQIASLQNDIIEKCNTGILRKYLNSLFLKNLIAVKLLACGLLRLLSKNANAVVLAVLSGFHQEHSMSRSAAIFFILALLSGILHLSLVQDTVVTLPLIASGVFVALFVLALIAGRKIKFDPVLR